MSHFLDFVRKLCEPRLYAIFINFLNAGNLDATDSEMKPLTWHVLHSELTFVVHCVLVHFASLISQSFVCLFVFLKDVSESLNLAYGDVL